MPRGELFCPKVINSEYDASESKEKFIPSLSSGCLNFGMRAGRTATNLPSSRPLTIDSMDLNQVVIKNKKRTQQFAMKNQLGRDDRMFHLTDEYKNIQLENTRQQRQEEIEEKKRQRQYRIKLLEYCKNNPKRSFIVREMT